MEGLWCVQSRASEPCMEMEVVCDWHKIVSGFPGHLAALTTMEYSLQSRSVQSTRDGGTGDSSGGASI